MWLFAHKMAGYRDDQRKLSYSITETIGNSSKTRTMETQLSESVAVALLQAFISGDPLDIEL